MPGLVAFGRRWSVGSDDLFLPSVCLCCIHSVWLVASIVALVVSYDELSATGVGGCSMNAWHLLVIVIVLLAACFLLEMSLTIVSLRGSILHDTPRKPAQYIIYVLLFILAAKLVWSGFAAVWIYLYYFHCSLTLAKQIILGLVICTWLILFGVVITAWCTYDVAGRSWIKMKRYQANLKEMELKHPAYRRSGSRHRNWRQRKVIRAYQNSWNHRCRAMRLCCCMHRTERNRDSFADLARLLSEFFRDLDVVPSDVVVGLLLLRRLQRLEQCSIVKQKRNNTYEFLSGIAITPNTKFVAMNDPSDLEVFRNVVHFMHYASAAYGYLWYLIQNGCKGLWSLSSSLSDLSEVVVDDNCCLCNYAVIPTMFDPGSFDVIHATYHVDVGETPFFVVVDYVKEAIVISIRGTLSLKDVITDLNAEGEPLPLNPPKEDWQGHKGMVQAAIYMKVKLLEEKILEKAFNRSPERRTETYRLVLVGHSLGAGTAVILSVLLKEDYPNLECFAYSPPGGLLSMPVVEYTKSFVTSVIVGKDVVPRLGLSQMEALRADLLNAMKKSHKPKWHTIMSGIACCCCVKPEFAYPHRLSSAPSIQSAEFMRSRRSLKDLREVTINPNESAISLTVHQPLYLPGKIMQIVKHYPTSTEIKYETMWRRVIKKGEPVFQALWTEYTDYGQVLISPGMINDHMPDQVLDALHRVVNNHGPAKPQRTLAASTSPLMMSRDSLVGGVDSQSRSSPHKLYMETSFGSNDVSGTPKHSPEECTLMNPSPLIIDADAEVENNDGGELTPTNMGLMSDLLASFNMTWDYVNNLHERYLEKEQMMMTEDERTLGDDEEDTKRSTIVQQHHHPYYNHHPPLPPPPPHHERKASLDNSSSGCSEAGSTFKEIFGPLKYDEWMAPLASPETLSEISSLSSRASFLLPRDQSPLMRMKGGKNGTSSSLHRYKNGGSKANGGCGFGLGGGGTFNNNTHHNRSYSVGCTYPEIGDVSIISTTLCAQSQSTKGSFVHHNNGNGGVVGGGSDSRVEDLDIEKNGGGGGVGILGDKSTFYHLSEKDYRNGGGKEENNVFEENGTTTKSNGMTSSEFGQQQLQQQHQKRRHQKPSSEHVDVDNENGKEDEEEEEEDDDEEEEPKRVSDAKRVSFNLKRKYASKDSGCSVGELPGRYEPIYPIFSHQEEYGVPSLNSPHYNYCGHSPLGSPVLDTTRCSSESSRGDESNSRSRFQFPPPTNFTSPSSTAATTIRATTNVVVEDDIIVDDVGQERQPK